MPLDTMYGGGSGPFLPGHGNGRGDPFNMRAPRPQRPLTEGLDMLTPGRQRPVRTGAPIMQSGFSQRPHAPTQARPPIDLWAGAGEAAGPLGSAGALTNSPGGSIDWGMLAGLNSGGSTGGFAGQGTNGAMGGIGMGGSDPNFNPNKPGAWGDKFYDPRYGYKPGYDSAGIGSTWNEPFADNPVMRGMGSLKGMYGRGSY